MTDFANVWFDAEDLMEDDKARCIGSCGGRHICVQLMAVSSPQLDIGTLRRDQLILADHHRDAHLFDVRRWTPHFPRS